MLSVLLSRLILHDTKRKSEEFYTKEEEKIDVRGDKEDLGDELSSSDSGFQF